MDLSKHNHTSIIQITQDINNQKDKQMNPSQAISKNRSIAIPTNQAIPIGRQVNIASLFGYELANIRKVPDFSIIKFIRKLYPVEQSFSNNFISLYKTIFEYMKIMFKKECQNRSQLCSDKFHLYALVSKQIVKCANFFNGDLGSGIKLVLDREDVREKLLSRLYEGITAPIPQKLANKTAIDLFSTISLKQKQLNRKIDNQKMVRNFSGTFQPTNKKNQEFVYKQKSFVKNLKAQLKTKSTIKCIICQKNFKKQQKIFKCEQCRRKFHYVCNSRKYNCIFCQLKHINPNHPVQQQLFVGIMGKNIKKHQIFFNYSQDPEQQPLSCYLKNHNQNNHLIVQVRSLRVKSQYDANASYTVLFPDACTLSLNKKLLKEFEPLHRQSALKYRQDQLIVLNRNQLKKGVNYLYVVERFLNKQIAQNERIQPQNHLIGIYIVKQYISPTQFVKKSKSYQFQESERLLKESLLINSGQVYSMTKQGKQQQPELACETQKISLICSLTLQKLKYPGRSIFCNHVQCFDVLNFVILNCDSKMPRWQCPICKAPAYKFLIDPILKQIIQLTNSQKYTNKQKTSCEWKEIIIDKELKFRGIDTEGEQGQQLSIYDLNINKRKRSQKIIQIQQGKPKKKYKQETINEIGLSQLFESTIKGNDDFQMENRPQQGTQKEMQRNSSQEKYIQLDRIQRLQITAYNNQNQQIIKNSQHYYQQYPKISAIDDDKLPNIDQQYIKCGKNMLQIAKQTEKTYKLSQSQHSQSDIIDELIRRKQVQFECKKKQDRFNRLFMQLLQNDETVGKNQQFQAKDQVIPCGNSSQSNSQIIQEPGLKLKKSKNSIKSGENDIKQGEVYEIVLSDRQ